MQYEIQGGETFNSLARDYTIGGTAYGRALAITNGYPADYADIPFERPARSGDTVIEIPDEWLGLAVTDTPQPIDWAKWLGVASGIAVAAYTLSGTPKRSPARSRRARRRAAYA